MESDDPEVEAGVETQEKKIDRNPLGAIAGCPCLICPDSNKCSELGSASPLNCPQLREWVLVSIELGED